MSLYEILTLLTYVIGGIVVFVIKDKAEELKRQGILLNKTREEVARDYITKIEVRSDMDQIINRFDRLEAKLDSFIAGHK
jgi:archaellum component FlaC